MFMKCQALPSEESEHVEDQESAEKTIGKSPLVSKSIALLSDVGMLSESRKHAKHFLKILCHITVILNFIYFTETKSRGIQHDIHK